MQRIEIDIQNKKTFILERLPIRYKAMVHELGCYWNQRVASLRLMQSKLVDSGILTD